MDLDEVIYLGALLKTQISGVSLREIPSLESGSTLERPVFNTASANADQGAVILAVLSLGWRASAAPGSLLGMQIPGPSLGSTKWPPGDLDACDGLRTKPAGSVLSKGHTVLLSITSEILMSHRLLIPVMLLKLANDLCKELK